MKEEMNKLLSLALNLDLNDIEDISTCSINDVIHIYVTIKNKIHNCDYCDSLMVKNGFYKRTIKVPNKIFENSIVHLKIHRYRCLKCNSSISDNVYVSPNKRSLSYASVIEIMELLKEPSETFRSVARKCQVSESTVLRVFDKHCHIPRLKLPKVLCIDEVYTKLNNYKSKYSCVLYDFINQSIVDVYPSRRMDYLRYALKYIPKSERDNVEYICMDMYKPYKLIVKEYFKKATICVDSFHVIKDINDSLKKIRINIMKQYNPSSLEYYLIKNFNYLLHDRNINLDNKARYNKRFDRYLNYRDLLNLLLSINSKLEKAYELKEIYTTFNASMNYEEAKDNFDHIIDLFIEADIDEYKDIVSMLKNWKEEITNSFIMINNRRINNGIAESINANIAKIIYNTKGIKDNRRRRKRIMYSINKKGFVLV